MIGFSSILLILLISSFCLKKFWKICPMEHLLTRLEVDSRPVSRRIANLLFNSFFPINQPENVWCERCVTLIQMNSAAARKFYQYAYEYTAPTNIGEVQNLKTLLVFGNTNITPCNCFSIFFSWQWYAVARSFGFSIILVCRFWNSWHQQWTLLTPVISFFNNEEPRAFSFCS